MADKRGKKGLFRRLLDSLIERRTGNELVYLAIGVLVGVVLSQILTLISTQLSDFLYNLAPEAVGIVFTVVVLNRLDQIRENRQTFERLVREMHSRYNQFALQAIEELRVLGWLSDGRLRGYELKGSDWKGANLYQANLIECDLQRVNFENADLYQADLTDAKVSPAQLRLAKTMRYATMPNGKKYDGRYNLSHDLELMADPRPAFYADRNDPAQVAKFYEVEVEDYLNGQRPEVANAPFEI